MLTLESRTSTQYRVASIDQLRGLVMILMALDHTRSFFHIDAHVYDPTDLEATTPFLFFTRWLTHFCAPIFVFLAGTSAFLSGTRKKSITGLSLFLLSRGLWLILLEVTVINFALFFNIEFGITLLQVIWTIGASMICLSALVFLPWPIILLLGLIIVCGHNLLPLPLIQTDNRFIQLAWSLLYQPATFQLSDNHLLFITYPLLPWLGVILLGYCFGKMYQNYATQERQTLFWQLGLCMIGLFLILRLINNYGDPRPWTLQSSAIYTLLSFLNVTKYPPSLLYVLMTLGPGLLFLYFIENRSSDLIQVFNTFGRVPLFFYILHLYIIHFFALLTAFSAGFTWSDFDFSHMAGGLPSQFGYNLPRIYLIWICIIGLMYPVCKKYNRFKSQRRSWWLSYL